MDQLDPKTGEEEIRIKSKAIENILERILKSVDPNTRKLHIQIVKCTKWQIGKTILSEPIFLWPISSIQDVGITYLKQYLSTLSLDVIVEKEFFDLAESLVSKRPPKKSEINVLDVISKRGIADSPSPAPSLAPLLSVEELNGMIKQYYGNSVTTEKQEQIRHKLHELGYILDYSSHKLNKILYDPQWLADLFKCIVGLKHQQVLQHGMIQRSDVEASLRQAFASDKDSIHKLVDLLQSFDIFVPHPQHHTQLALPFLMGADRPPDVDDQIKKLLQSDTPKLGRKYKFPFLPPGILSQVILKLHEPEFQSSCIIKFWRNGILFTWTKSYVVMEYSETLLTKDVKEFEVKITAIGKGHKKVLRTVEELFLMVLWDQYPLLLEEMKSIIYCYYFGEEFSLDYDECFNKFQRNENINLKDKHIIPAADLFYDETASQHLQLKNDLANLDLATDLVRGQLLGEGNYGKVFKCRFNSIPGCFVIKDFRIKEQDEETTKKIIESFEQEEKLMKLVKHKHIVPLVYSAKTPDSLSLIYEYYDCSLFDYLKTQKEIPQTELIEMWAHIAKGLEYLHITHLIVHLDLKVTSIIHHSSSSFFHSFLF